MLPVVTMAIAKHLTSEGIFYVSGPSAAARRGRVGGRAEGDYRHKPERYGMFPHRMQFVNETRKCVPWVSLCLFSVYIFSAVYIR